MLYSTDELKQFAQNFASEIEKSKNGEKTSFAYSKNQIPENNLVNEGTPFQVIMMGGSHLESVLVKIENGQVEMMSFFEEDLPKLDSKEIVSEIFAKHINPNVSVISLNFAYPMKAITRDGMLDGVLIGTSKEHRFEGLMNEVIGQTLEEYFMEHFNRKISVTVCNDTVALGLASYGYDINYNWENTVAGVVGTGTNFGLFESKNMFINLECGNFNKFKQSETGMAIDALSQYPGRQALEKEVAGAYLCSHFNIMSKVSGYNVILKTTKELSELASKNEEASDLAKAVIERSSSLVATQIYGLYLNKKREYELKNEQVNNFNLLVMLEGSLYWHGYNYKEYVNKYLEEFGILNNIKIGHVDKIGIVGSAKLACK